MSAAIQDSKPAAGDFSAEQKHYLGGFMAGLAARGVTFRDIAEPPAPAAPAIPEDLTKEERIKRELHPLDAIEQLTLDARWNAVPDPDNAFRYKWNGLFWLSPVKDAYMCRLRIPGGMIRSFQLREIASIARELTTGYIQITTRSNLQIRLIEPRNCPEVLRRIQSVGLHTRGSGADNVRNITMNPCAGFDPHELIDVRPLVHELAGWIVSGREFQDLPRKFNIAYDGGGLVGSVEDTNDIGATAVRIDGNDKGIEPGVYFRIALGGATGHQAFASDCGFVVPPDRLNQVIAAILRVFVRDGDRSDRRKARLKFLLAKTGMEAFLNECAKLLPFAWTPLPADSPIQLPRDFSQQRHSHVGIHPQRQEGMFSIGADVPVGQLTPAQLEKIAEIADRFGSGEARLTVWQNFIVPDIPGEKVKAAEKALQRAGFGTTSSPLRSGFVACTGNRYCKFAATDTKAHAIAIMNRLDRRVKLDQPVNIHFTGCAHSCAQHFMGDIGLLGTKTKSPSGEGYHITVGGGFGENRRIGRQIFTAVSVESLEELLECMLKRYLERRHDGESFHSFCGRHSTGELQEMWSSP